MAGGILSLASLFSSLPSSRMRELDFQIQLSVELWRGGAREVFSFVTLGFVATDLRHRREGIISRAESDFGVLLQFWRGFIAILERTLCSPLKPMLRSFFSSSPFSSRDASLAYVRSQHKT